MTDLDLTDDMIDVRDIIARIEELENLIEGEGCDDTCDEYNEELKALMALMQELKGMGGDEQWQGDWYPLALIRDSYFTDYTRELLEDCGDLPRDFPHYIEIDWKATARNIQIDYSSVEINGVTYWTR